MGDGFKAMEEVTRTDKVSHIIKPEFLGSTAAEKKYLNAFISNADTVIQQAYAGIKYKEVGIDE